MLDTVLRISHKFFMNSITFKKFTVSYAGKYTEEG